MPADSLNGRVVRAVGCGNAGRESWERSSDHPRQNASAHAEACPCHGTACGAARPAAGRRPFSGRGSQDEILSVLVRMRWETGWQLARGLRCDTKRNRNEDQASEACFSQLGGILTDGVLDGLRRFIQGLLGILDL